MIRDHLILSGKWYTEPHKRVEKFDLKQGVILDHLTNRRLTEQGVILDHLPNFASKMWYWITQKELKNFNWKQGVILDHLTNRKLAEQGVILDHLLRAVTCDNRSPWVWYWITQKSLRIWLVVRCDTESPNLGSNVCTLGVILDHPKELMDLIDSKVWYWVTVWYYPFTGRLLQASIKLPKRGVRDPVQKGTRWPMKIERRRKPGWCHTWAHQVRGIPYLSFPT